MSLPAPDLRKLPSVDAVLKAEAARVANERFGRRSTVAAIRKVLARLRDEQSPSDGVDGVAVLALRSLEDEERSALRPVFNLTGTVLHTNLGRALLAEAAIEAAAAAMRSAVTLEFDLGGGHRGQRDDAVRGLLRELTGAEDASAVNNNAAAVLIALNTLALGKDAVVSRGELIEIGGAFRMPDIMARAGARLVEVGTTNRTHLKDYEGAIGPETGLILKVHTSNYRIEGFTKEVGAAELARLARARGVPLVNDLGSGTFVDLTRWGPAHEPTVAESVAQGADLVTFSGDKLMGGPQAGLIVGRRELIERINRNPMKRAVRLDKIRLAALEATLKLYRDPDRLVERLPALRLIARPEAEIEVLARRILPSVAKQVSPVFGVEIVPCQSEIGSGALPLSSLNSAGLAVRPKARRRKGTLLDALSTALRGLPVPVIGRIESDALILDLRCLEDDAGFVRNLGKLEIGEVANGMD